jgi:TonB-linked SusC/RagA family outer membrane protein
LLKICLISKKYVSLHPIFVSCLIFKRENYGKKINHAHGGLVLSTGMALAQTTVTGKVVSQEDGEPVIGASIKIEGTKMGTVTDVDGNFSLVAPNGNAKLVISYLGMKSQKVVAKSKMKIVLEGEDNTLNDVVVTALGVSRQKKALGYAVTELKGDEMLKSRGGLSNPVNALQGKVAGLTISSSAGSMGGSSKVLLRGANSLSGSNQPLFVIDGVPIEGGDNNSTETQRGGGYDYGNLIQDINPDDVENISVLKGASATALYGSRASNGVIMITTKRAKKSAGLGVEFSSSVGFETVTKLPKLQSQYGGGYGYAGDYAYGDDGDDMGTATINGKEYLIPDYGQDESWGPKLDGRQVLSWYDLLTWKNNGSVGDPTTSAWSPASSDYRDFFKTGVSYTNNIAVSQSYDNSSFRISYTNTSLTGYLPNSSQYKNALNVTGNIMSPDKKLNVFTSVNYFNNRTKGRQDTGYGDNNIMVKFTQWGQRQLNMNELKSLYKNPDGSQASWNIGGIDDTTIQFHNNPYWSRYMNYENDSRNRVYGNVGFSYQIIPQLKFQYKANANVTIHVQKIEGTRLLTTKAGDKQIALGDVCSRLTLAIFDGEEKLETVNQLSTDNGFGTAYVSLDEGEYRLVVIAHNGKGNCSISAPEKVKFASNKLTDTFYYYGRLSVTADGATSDINLR